METVCVQFGSRKPMKSENYEDKNEAVMQTDTSNGKGNLKFVYMNLKFRVV